MKTTWTPGALQHDGGGRTLIKSRWNAEVTAYPLEDRSACQWPDRWRRVVLEIMALPPPDRDEPRPRAGELVAGRLWFGDDLDAVRVLENGGPS